MSEMFRTLLKGAPMLVLLGVLLVVVELTARRAFAQDLPPRANWSLE